MDTDSKTLVTGATGDIGGTLVRLLKDSGHPFRVMCRRPDQVEAFAADGVEAVHGDFADPASVRQALEACDQLFLLPPFTAQMVEQTTAAIDAAREADVGHVVKISAADANPDSPVPWAADHGRVDTYLRASGLSWTLLRPSCFFNLLAVMAPAIRRGLLPGMSGHGATTFIDSPDIAAAAARVLTDPSTQGGLGDQGRDYLLTGTQPLSLPQAAEILTAELGHRVRYLPVPAPLVYLAARAKGVPVREARGIVNQFAVVVRRGLDNVRVHSTDLEHLIGRPPTDMSTYVRTHRTELT